MKYLNVITLNRRAKHAIRVALAILGLLWFYFFVARPIDNERRAFLKEEYFGRINKIEFRKGNRGYPFVQLDEEWRLFTNMESSILSYIQVGDSVVKKSGTTTIVVFRKDSFGTYMPKEF